MWWAAAKLELVSSSSDILLNITHLKMMQWYGIVRRHIQWFLIRWFCHAWIRRSNLQDWEIAKDFHHCLDYFNSKDENFNLSSPIGWRYESTRNLTRAEINNCRNMKICHLYYFKFQISNFLLPTWYFLDYPRGILGVGSRKKIPTFRLCYSNRPNQ